MAGFFGIGDYNKPGPGVRKDEPEKKGAARYFAIMGKRIWKLITLNALYTLFSIIPFLIMYTICNFCMVWIMNYNMSPEEMKEWLDNGGTLLMIAAAMFFYAINGGGAAACGMINVLRKYVDDTHAWVWQDFWDGFKSNFLQGTAAFVTDCAAMAVLMINFGFYNFVLAENNSVFLVIARAALLLVSFVWAMMHVYIYPTMTSFKFKLKNVYKNSFLMVLGKLPHTAAAFFLGAAIALVIVYLSAAVLYIALLIPIIMFVLCEYTRLTIVYPLMKKYMQDPEQRERERHLEALRRDISEDGGTVFSDDRVDE